MLITAFVVPALVLMQQRKMNGQVREQRAALSTEVTEVLYGFRDLKVYGQLIQREQQLQQTSAALASRQRRDAGQLLRGQSMHIFVTYLVTWGVLLLSSFLIADGVFAGVYLAMLILAAQTVFEESAAMAVLPAYKLDSEYAAKRLNETVRTSEEKNDQPQGLVPMPEEAVSIDLSHVSYQYEDEWRRALNDVSVHFPSGSKTAIVGPSGSGKSTIMDVLLKLRSPVSGSIQVNGIPIKQLQEESIWQNTRVVLQQSHFFRGTIRDNLLLSEEGHMDAELEDVLHQVQLFNLSLNDTVYEKGENLSDGEKQRLALARAMLHRGRLWLLDEPTSSLDYVTEARVLQQLLAQAAEDTLLLICHRLTGLEHMDQIIVMDQGRVVETGSFKVLMEQKGYFYEMKQIELQMIGESKT
jgi:ATP-binding cassette subfamily C protein CydC